MQKTYRQKSLKRGIQRSLQISMATPKWLTESQKNEMIEIYWNCPDDRQVDHIIPICGKDISGLNVPWNLQYLEKEVNSYKTNKFDGTYENTTSQKVPKRYKFRGDEEWK